LVRREEFATLAQQHRDPQALCAALIDLANARGGPDNITVVIARFEGDGLSEAQGAEGVGYQTYQFPSAGDQDDLSITPETPSTRSPESAPPLDRLRNVGLIALVLGVLILLLAVWR
jgi:protein phosphatase